MKKCCDNGKCAGFLRFLPPPSGSLAVAGLFVVGLAYAETACPTGMVPYQGPAVTQMENSNGECADLCDTGMRAIMMADGSKRIDLFKTASTARKMVANYGDSMCYADVVAGSQEGALNVDIDGVVHYVAPSNWKICPPKYTLSYDCGDADSGTIASDQNQIVTYGQVFSAGYPETTCFKKGQYIYEWKIGNTSITPNNYAVWQWDSDQVAVAQWRKRVYGGAYLCNHCQYPWISRTQQINYNKNRSGRVGETYTLYAPNTTNGPSCGVPKDAVFLGYDIYNAYTNEPVGKFVSADDLTFTWEWDFAISYRARWEWDHVADAYTLSYSCGVDADGVEVPGTPPESKTIRYNELFNPGWDPADCRRDGYYISKWKIGTTEYNRAGFNTWTYEEDMVATAVWSPETYSMAYACNNGETTTVYASVNYKQEITPAVDVCTAPEGKVLKGYQIYGPMGYDTGVSVAAGDSFVYDYLNNISLYAIWEDATVTE